MISLLDDLLGVQKPQILHLPPGVASLEGAEEALDLADAVGMTLDEAQRFALRSWLGETAEGVWAAFECGLIEARQNGKGEVIEARELAGLFVFGEMLIIHTAHEFATANEAFLRMVARIESCDDLRRQVRSIRYANGEQGIELLSGARLKYRARTGGAGRGFAGAALVVLDESYALKAEQVAAVLPTLSTHPNPQVIYASSAGLTDSTALHRLRRRALSGEGGRLAWCEHTAERPELVDGRVVSAPIDVTDRRLWAEANPALGTRISVEYVASELDAMGADRFARERLGVWDPEPTTIAAEAKLPAAEWASSRTTRRPDVKPGAVVLGFEVGPDMLDASIAIAAGTSAEPWVGLMATEDGTGWLAAKLVELALKWRPRSIGFNNAGTTLAVLPPIVEAFARAGLSDRLLAPLSAGAWRAACGGFFGDVVEHRLTRPFDQEPLDAAGGVAHSRPFGAGWAWVAKPVGSVSVSPLMAVTAARAVLPAEKPSPVGDFIVV